MLATSGWTPAKNDFRNTHGESYKVAIRATLVTDGWQPYRLQISRGRRDSCIPGSSGAHDALQEEWKWMDAQKRSRCRDSWVAATALGLNAARGRPYAARADPIHPFQGSRMLRLRHSGKKPIFGMRMEKATRLRSELRQAWRERSPGFAGIAVFLDQVAPTMPFKDEWKWMDAQQRRMCRDNWVEATALGLNAARGRPIPLHELIQFILFKDRECCGCWGDALI
ncbi:unnamed protein product, partial [Mesorhabditis spiculigera]